MSLRNFFIFLFICIFAPSFGEIRRVSSPVFFGREKLLYQIRMLGTQVGFQTIFFDSSTNYRGKHLWVGRGSTVSTPFFKALYPVDDREVSFFSTNEFLPHYYERWVSEGSWKDHWKFFFKEREFFEYQMQSKGNRFIRVSMKEPIYNYITLIQVLRNIDVDWYLTQRKKVKINYLFGDKVIRSEFSVFRKEIKLNGKQEKIFEVKEEKGLGLILRYSDDALRIPYQLVLPGYTVPGFKTINIVATLSPSQ